MKSEVKCLQNYMMAFELTAATENFLFYRGKKKEEAAKFIKGVKGNEEVHPL